MFINSNICQHFKIDYENGRSHKSLSVENVYDFGGWCRYYLYLVDFQN